MTDNFGNNVNNQLTVNITNEYPPIKIAFEEKIITIGDEIKLPEVVVNGGCGQLTTDVTYYYNDEPVNTEKLIIDKLGTLQVKVHVKDSLDKTNSDIKAYKINAKNIVDVKGYMPEYVLKGKTLNLPEFTAIDYTNNTEHEKSVYVNGKSVNAE